MNKLCGCRLRLALLADWETFVSAGSGPARSDADDLLAQLRSAESRQISQGILVAARCCEFRRRVLLQWLLPDLIREANRLRSADLRSGQTLDCSEVGQRVVAAAVEAISHLAGRPVRWPLLALQSEFRRRLRVERCAEKPWLSSIEFNPAVAPAAVAQGDEFGVLADAIVAGAIGKGDAEIISLTRVHGYSLEQVAAMRGSAYRAVQQRRRRAEHRLVDYLAGSGPAS